MRAQKAARPRHVVVWVERVNHYNIDGRRLDSVRSDGTEPKARAGGRGGRDG